MTGPRSTTQNIIRCVQDIGLRIAGLVPQSLASALSVLNEDEKSMGVTLVDIGGGTCDLLTYYQGHIVDMGSLAIGGQNFTNDVAVGLRTTLARGEELKREWGVASSEMTNREEVLRVGEEDFNGYRSNSGFTTCVRFEDPWRRSSYGG